ncbi:unnamed protein product [Rotaria sordida]|uniref:Uncharacterized protein n=1 Tax=Rotaria sordida TaxID=392033 RepID=A0A819NRL8_9BILA|nr:unnamed protein product [Rotaria sordida]
MFVTITQKSEITQANTSPIFTATETRTILSETSNLFTTFDSTNDRATHTLSIHDSCISTSTTALSSVSTLSISTILSLASPSSPSTISVPSSLLPIDISRSVLDPPSQSFLLSYKINKDKCFQKQWYNNRSWLEHFGSTNNLINRNQSDAFLRGYNNWKNALVKNRRFHQHQTSTAHITATLNYNQFLVREKSQLSVVNVIEHGRIEQIRKNRNHLIKISSVILLCARQMISLRDSVVTSTIGQQDDDENEYYYRTYIDYQVIDNMLVELEDRFSSKNLELLSGISSLCPDSNTFLDFDSLKPIANHLNVDLQVLSNELMVVKPMLQNKSLTTIIDLYKELYRFQEVFPSLVTLI